MIKVKATDYPVLLANSTNVNQKKAFVMVALLQCIDPAETSDIGDRAEVLRTIAFNCEMAGGPVTTRTLSYLLST